MLTRALVRFFTSLLFVLTVSFLVIRIVPGDSIDESEAETPSEALTAAEVRSYQHSLRQELGLDLPVFYISFENGISFTAQNQFHHWLFGRGATGKGIVSGDLGRSFRTGQPVSQLIAGQLPWSFGLSLTALVLSFFLCIPAGLYAAGKKNSVTDRLACSFSIILLSVPVFWVAALLQYLFANPDMLDWFRAAGSGPTRNEHPSFTERLPFLILPTLCYILGASAFLLRFIRDSAIRELATDHIRTARAKGLSEKIIRNVHVLRKMSPTLLTVFGNALPVVLSGSVLIENIFALPGMGRLIETALQQRDYPVLSGVFLLTAVFTLSIQLIIDLAVARLDPTTTIVSA